jgi:predicted secreted protein
MIRIVDLAVSARRVVSAAALIGALGTPAHAGDRALIDLIGFSQDGRYFAFEEFGTQDGSGFPYSNIYVLDLPADDWVTGSPIRVRLDDETATLGQAREQAADDASGVIESLAIDSPPDLIAINADGELGDGAHLTFGVPGYFPNNVQGAHTLKLETYSANSPEPCESYMGELARGFALTLFDASGERQIFRDDTLPASRGCPSTYRIYAVVAPQYAAVPTSHVVIIATYPFGFEGPDRRFIAIPLELTAD